MQEVAVLVFCDVCFKENGERVKAEYSEVVSFGNVTRRLELCPAHVEEIIGRLPQVLTSYGNKVEATRRRGRPSKSLVPDIEDLDEMLGGMSEGGEAVPCPRCGQTYKSRTNVMAHARERHDPPLNMEEMKTLVPDADLYECDQQGCQVVSIGKLGLTTHLRTSHGIAKERQPELQDA